VVCRGNDYSGQASPPASVDGTANAISAGGAHSCAIQVPEPGSGVLRSVALVCVTFLAAWKRRRRGDSLLDALQAEQKRLEQAPIRRLNLHATRHTFASQAFAEMMDPSWVSRQLGHHNVAFTLDTYVHLLPGRRDFAAVDFGDQGASGHNEVTRSQIRARDDDRTVH